MKFYQLLVTNWHNNSMDVLFSHVCNHSTLAEAMQNPFYKNGEKPGVGEGEVYKDPTTGREHFQFHLHYVNERGEAVFELRHERFVKDERGTSTEQKQVLIKEIILPDADRSAQRSGEEQ